MSTTGLQHGAGEIGWLVSRFVEETAEVADAIVVSSDGLLLAISPNLDRTAADKLAAIVSGLRSLSEGVSAVTGRGGFSQAMIELADGYLVVSAISDGSSIGVVAARNADLGAVGYGTTLLVERVGAALTPALIDELKLGLSSPTPRV
jgi:predicted regulator of Ras-like GTPase activity (Roadblock/LC7/MglB family)